MPHLESDLHVASFLLAKGFKFLGLELVGSRYAFKFDNSNGDAAEAALDYSRGALVPAREFAAGIQRLKTDLYTTKFKENGNERKRAKYSHQ